MLMKTRCVAKAEEAVAHLKEQGVDAAQEAALRKRLAAMKAESAEEQAAAFDYALERMAELCRQAEQKRDAQSRLFASLGALSGACALMILW